MKSEVIEGVLTFMFGVVFVAGILAWQVYKYDDCRKVGHTRVYCLFAKG